MNVDSNIDVPAERRDAAAKCVDQMEVAFRLFLKAAKSSLEVKSSLGSASGDSLDLVQQIVAAKLSYARQVIGARNLREAVMAHNKFLRTQISIARQLLVARSTA